MIARLIADASYCHDTRAGAWAAWAESKRGRFFGGNALVGCGNINPLEMRAAALGLAKAIERGIIVAGDRVILQTDSHYVACRLTPGFLSSRQRRRARLCIGEPTRGLNNSSPRGAIVDMVAAYALSVEVLLSSAGRELAHVDRFARRCMVEERHRLLGRTSAEAHMVMFEADLETARRQWIVQEIERQRAGVA